MILQDSKLPENISFCHGNANQKALAGDFNLPLDESTCARATIGARHAAPLRVGYHNSDFTNIPIRYRPFDTAEVHAMSQDYLLKTEPSEYSFADLLRDGTTEWEGVTAPAAVKHLREMTAGARLIIYETGARKSAVGTATVVSVSVPDPKSPKVKIKVGKAIAKPVSLDEIKANKLFKDSPLVRIGRLSVVPLTKEQFAALTGA
jgi:predicted RNA-binding protein with PUA-like domain